MGNGLKVENRTGDSRPWIRRRRYCVSFELYPRAKSEEHSVFSGTAYSYSETFTSWLEPVKVVVKTKRAYSPRTSTDWTLDYLERHKISTAFVQPFNVLLEQNGRSERLTIIQPTIARMSAVSDLMPIMRVLKRFGKVLRKGEVVLIEAKIRGPFRYFTLEDGSDGPDHVEVDDVIDAFGHFAFHHSNATIVLCNLKGSVNRKGNRFRLVAPVVHSTDMRGGCRDAGVHGIREFFRFHQCNYLCADFLQWDTA